MDVSHFCFFVGKVLSYEALKYHDCSFNASLFKGLFCKMNTPKNIHLVGWRKYSGKLHCRLWWCSVADKNTNL